MAFALHPIGRALALWLVCSASAHAGLAAFTEQIAQQVAQPRWAELTDRQRETLAPLAESWDEMEAFRRKKWLGIAERFPAMSPEEQARIRQRMREWAALTPEERRLARDKYRSLQRVSPELRESLRQNWEDYRALPPEEKRRLQSEAMRRPPVSTIPPAGQPPRLRERAAP